jgi:hypothetical protein
MWYTWKIGAKGEHFGRELVGRSKNYRNAFHTSNVVDAMLRTLDIYIDD